MLPTTRMQVSIPGTAPSTPGHATSTLGTPGSPPSHQGHQGWLHSPCPSHVPPCRRPPLPHVARSLSPRPPRFQLLFLFSLFIARRSGAAGPDVPRDVAVAGVTRTQPSLAFIFFNRAPRQLLLHSDPVAVAVRGTEGRSVPTAPPPALWAEHFSKHCVTAKPKRHRKV